MAKSLMLKYHFSQNQVHNVAWYRYSKQELKNLFAKFLKNERVLFESKSFFKHEDLNVLKRLTAQTKNSLTSLLKLSCSIGHL